MRNRGLCVVGVELMERSSQLPITTLSWSVTLGKREPFLGKTHFSGAATETKGKREPLNN